MADKADKNGIATSNGHGELWIPEQDGTGVYEIVKAGPVMSEIGTSGLRRFAGIVMDEGYLPNMSFYQSTRVYAEMQNNEPIIGASLFAIENLMRQARWHVEPFSSKPKDKDAAEFVESCMHDMAENWIDVISEALTMLPFGWALHEIVYKRRNGTVSDDPADPMGMNSRYDDGKIGWKKVPLRAQETLVRWEFGPKGEILGMWQLAPPDFELMLIPMSKCLLFRTTVKKNDPQGRSILRSAYRPYYFKRRIEEVEGVGIERDLAGLPMALVDPAILSAEASVEEKAMLEAIKQIVVNVRRDAQEGIIFPLAYDELGHQLYDFKLLSSGGTRQLDVRAAIEARGKEIAQTMLTDFILLGHEGVGSFALSSDKTTLFADAIGTFMDLLAEPFNKIAIPRLFHYNGMDITRLPKISHEKIQKPDLSVLALIMTAAVNAGILQPDDPLADWLREICGMPKRDPTTLITPPVPPMPGGDQAAGGQPGQGPGPQQPGMTPRQQVEEQPGTMGQATQQMQTPPWMRQFQEVGGTQSNSQNNAQGVTGQNPRQR